MRCIFSGILSAALAALPLQAKQSPSPMRETTLIYGKEKTVEGFIKTLERGFDPRVATFLKTRAAGHFSDRLPSLERLSESKFLLRKDHVIIPVEIISAEQQKISVNNHVITLNIPNDMNGSWERVRRALPNSQAGLTRLLLPDANAFIDEAIGVIIVIGIVAIVGIINIFATIDQCHQLGNAAKKCDDVNESLLTRACTALDHDQAWSATDAVKLLEFKKSMDHLIEITQGKGNWYCSEGTLPLVKCAALVYEKASACFGPLPEQQALPSQTPARQAN